MTIALPPMIVHGLLMFPQSIERKVDFKRKNRKAVSLGLESIVDTTKKGRTTYENHSADSSGKL